MSSHSVVVKHLYDGSQKTYIGPQDHILKELSYDYPAVVAMYVPQDLAQFLRILNRGPYSAVSDEGEFGDIVLKSESPPKPTPELIAVHNTTVDAIRAHHNNHGQIPAPSIAIKRADHPFESFGGITLLAKPHLVDPKTTPVFAADVYSTRRPKIYHPVDPKKVARMEKLLEPYNKAVGRWVGVDTDGLSRRGEHGGDLKYGARWTYATSVLGHDSNEVARKPRSEHFSNHPIVVDWLKQQPNNNQPLTPEQMAEMKAKYHESAAAYNARKPKRLHLTHDDVEESFGNSNHKAMVVLAHRGNMDPVMDRFEAIKWADDKIDKSPNGEDGFAKWYDSNFGDWKDHTKTPYFTHHTSTGNRVKKPATPENILKVLTAKVRGGEQFDYGSLGQTRSLGVTQFKSPQTLKEAADRLVSSTEFDQTKDDLDERFGAISEKFAKYGPGHHSVSHLLEAVKDHYKRIPLRGSLESLGYKNVPNELVQELQQFASHLKDAPTEYFEAKPKRMVGLNEFHTAVIPPSTPQDVREALKGHGLNIIEYKGQQGDPSSERTQKVKEAATTHNLFLAELNFSKSESDVGSGSAPYNTNDHIKAAIAAAELLTSQKVDPLKFREHLRECDDPYIAVQLALGMVPTTDAYNALLGLTHGLHKSETKQSFETVEPLTPKDKPFAVAVQVANDKTKIEPIHLGGVHSKGTLLASPSLTIQLLMKPGAGPQNPGSGMYDSPISQSRREAAFAAAAQVMGLQEEVEPVGVVVCDGVEYAVGGLIPYDYKDFNSRHYTDDFIFNNRLLDVFKWAATDYILGNPDRNAGNIMSRGTDVRLIDHGSTLAGDNFNPAHDKYSFIPYYLRAVTRHLKSTTDSTKPRLSTEQNDQIHNWLHQIDENHLSAAIEQYGADPRPILKRLEELKASQMPPDLAILWAWGL